jgi:hypothetical protein
MQDWIVVQKDWRVPQEGRGLVLGIRGSLEDWKMPKRFGSLRRRRVSWLPIRIGGLEVPLKFWRASLEGWSVPREGRSVSLEV